MSETAVTITPSEPGSFDRMRAYRKKHGCSVREACKATGYRGTRIDTAARRMLSGRWAAAKALVAGGK